MAPTATTRSRASTCTSAAASAPDAGIAPRDLPRRAGGGLPGAGRAHAAGLPRATAPAPTRPSSPSRAGTRSTRCKAMVDAHGSRAHDASRRQPPASVPLIPESAPFSPEQRAWLNGFFAGLLSLDARRARRRSPATCRAPRRRRWRRDDDGEAPWHDPAMPIDERMTLAEGRPLRAQAVRRHGAAGLRPVRLSVRDLLGGHRRGRGDASSTSACPAARRRAACSSGCWRRRRPPRPPRPPRRPRQRPTQAPAAAPGYCARCARSQAVFRSATRLNGGRLGEGHAPRRARHRRQRPRL